MVPTLCSGRQTVNQETRAPPWGGGGSEVAVWQHRPMCCRGRGQQGGPSGPGQWWDGARPCGTAWGLCCAGSAGSPGRALPVRGLPGGWAQGAVSPQAGGSLAGASRTAGVLGLLAQDQEGREEPWAALSGWQLGSGQGTAAWDRGTSGLVLLWAAADARSRSRQAMASRRAGSRTQ